MHRPSQTVKLALKGLAFNMAAELQPHGVAAIAITPGFLRSESMLEHMGITEANWRDGGKTDKNLYRNGSHIQLGWLDSLSKRTKRFLSQLPRTGGPSRTRARRG